MTSPRVDGRALGRLKWRCRRGLLENDLFLERFFDRHEAQITEAQADALLRLMELSDHDLLDLLLRRREPGDDLTSPEVLEVLQMLRPPAPGTHG